MIIYAPMYCDIQWCIILVLALDDDFSFMDLSAPGKGEVCLETAEFLQRLT